MFGLDEWGLNFIFSSYQAQTEEALATIKNPIAEYCIYGTFKMTQLASAVGGLIVHPIYRWYLIHKLKQNPDKQTPNSRKIIRNKCRRIQGRFFIGGLVAGPLLTAAYIYTERMSYHDLRTRCYRIRLDRDNLHTDRCTVIGALIGWYWKRFQGACDGCNWMMAYSILSNYVLRPHTYPLLQDKPLSPAETYGQQLDRKTALRRFLVDQGIREATGSRQDP